MSICPSISDRVAHVIEVELGVREEITEKTSLRSLVTDSLEFLNLIQALEDEFGIEAPDDKAQTFLTVGDICRYVAPN